MFSTIDFNSFTASETAVPQFPASHIDDFKTSDDIARFLKERNEQGIPAFITGLYDPEVTYTPKGRVTSKNNAMNQKKFKCFTKLLNMIPSNATRDIYFLGNKKNIINEKVMGALASPDNKLWEEGALIVEAIYTFMDKWSFFSMVLPHSNVETTGKAQFKCELRKLVNPAHHHLFSDAVLNLVVRSGERIIHLYKAVMALCNTKYAPKDPEHEIYRKNYKLNLDDPSLGLHFGATWQDVNLALLVQIIATDSDKKAKAFGQRVLCDGAIFVDANGADTNEIPINGVNATNLNRIGINAWKQALAYALRLANDEQFFSFVHFTVVEEIVMGESAIHGEFTDVAFGAFGAVRAQCDPHKTGTTDKKGNKVKFFNAMGKGVELIHLLMNEKLKGTVFDINMKPTDETHEKANPDFWNEVANIIVCNFLTPA